MDLCKYNSRWPAGGSIYSILKYFYLSSQVMSRHNTLNIKNKLLYFIQSTYTRLTHAEFECDYFLI